jgi:catalase-peroxidase
LDPFITPAVLGTGVDPLSNSQLREFTEVYGRSGAQKFIGDFVTAWVKVTSLDRFDVV